MGLSASLEPLKFAFRKSQIISFSLIGGIFIYYFIALWVNHSAYSPKVSREFVELLRTLFLAMAIMIIFLIKFLKSIILASGNKSNMTTKKRIEKLMITNIVELALAEGVTIFGLVLFLLTKNLNDFYPFFVFSIILIIVHLPKYSHWENWYLSLNPNQESNPKL